MSSLESLTRAALLARQQAVEQQLEALEETAESRGMYPGEAWELVAKMRPLRAEWQAIESEWERRAGLTGDEAMDDLLHSWPSE